MSLLLYFLLYSYNSFEKSLKSFIAFWLTLVIGLFYILGFIVLINGIPKPIFLENISVLSQYRYLLLSILSIIFILIYQVYPQLISTLTFPYLKEEIKKFLYLKQNQIFGPLFSYILIKLKHSYYQKIYMIIHSFLFSFFRIITLFFFINFIFFGGDLRYNLYLLPVSFFIWLLSFINYYFDFFFENEKNYIRCLLDVTPLSSLTPEKNGIIYTNEQNFSFQLTPFAYKEGYTNRINILADLWFELGRLDVFFIQYKKKIKIVNLTIIILQVFCWLMLTYVFFFRPYIKSYLFSGEDTISMFASSKLLRAVFRYTPPLQSPQAGYFVPTQFQQEAERARDSTYKRGHPILADNAIKNPDNPREILYGGQPTHGPGTSDNPSFFLASTSIDGSPIPQNFVPPKFADTWIDKKFCVKPIAGSEAYMADPKTKENHIKAMPQKEET